MAAYALIGVPQILVWNPLAAVPGAALKEIGVGLDRANESLKAPTVRPRALIGFGLAAIVLLHALMRPDIRVQDALARPPCFSSAPLRPTGLPRPFGHGLC